MTIITNAIYLNGVFKPSKHLNFTKKERVCLVAVPEKEWKEQFSKLLNTIHKKTIKAHSTEIEKDISAAFKEITK